MHCAFIDSAQPFLSGEGALRGQPQEACYVSHDWLHLNNEGIRELARFWERHLSPDGLRRLAASAQRPALPTVNACSSVIT